jgi:hypothetical protein
MGLKVEVTPEEAKEFIAAGIAAKYRVRCDAKDVEPKLRTESRGDQRDSWEVSILDGFVAQVESVPGR